MLCGKIVLYISGVAQFMKCIKVFCIVVVSLFIDNVFCMNANISEKINASINSVGDALIHNTKNTIYSIKDSQLEAVLYLTKDESQKYKEIIRQIENNDVIESVVHDTVGNKMEVIILNMSIKL